MGLFGTATLTGGLLSGLVVSTLRSRVPVAGLPSLLGFFDTSLDLDFFK